MGISLDEYATLYGKAEPENAPQSMIDAAESYNRQQEAQKTVEQLKTSIAQQLESGSAPEFILSTAIRAIGILTNDAEWADRQQGALDAVYGDLSQLSLVVDNAATAMQRLDEKRRKYCEKHYKSCLKVKKASEDIDAILNTVLYCLSEIYPDGADALESKCNGYSL